MSNHSSYSTCYPQSPVIPWFCCNLFSCRGLNTLSHIYVISVHRSDIITSGDLTYERPNPNPFFLDLLFFWLFLQFLSFPSSSASFSFSSYVHTPSLVFLHHSAFPLADISIIYVLIFTDSTCHSMNEVTASSVNSIWLFISVFQFHHLLHFTTLFILSLMLPLCLHTAFWSGFYISGTLCCQVYKKHFISDLTSPCDHFSLYFLFSLSLKVVLHIIGM